jgi:hypothetical protein
VLSWAAPALSFAASPAFVGMARDGGEFDRRPLSGDANGHQNGDYRPGAAVLCTARLTLIPSSNRHPPFDPGIAHL